MAARKSINQTNLAGLVGDNITTKQIKVEGEPQKKTVINFSLRTQEVVARDGVAEEDWHNVSFYGKIADRLCEVIQPGILLFITGRTKNRNYLDKSNKKKFGSNVIGKEFSVLNNQTTEVK